MSISLETSDTGALVDIPAASTVRAARAWKPTRRRLGPGRPIPFGSLLGTVLVVLFWSLGSLSGLLDQRTLPAPWTVIATAVRLTANGTLPNHLEISVWRAVQGLAL